MRGKIPLVSCAVAAVLGVAAGVQPEIRTAVATAEEGPTTRERLVAAFADQTWPTPRPGSWTPARPAPDGLPPVIRRINTQEKVVFLTIDDGYEYDAEFVEIVRREKVPILTFLTSTYVKGYGQYFWALRNAGSQMENHTVSHPNLAGLALEGQKKQICGASDTIAQQYGRRPQILRPPFGSMNEITRQAARDCGIKSILMWTSEFYNGTTSPSGVHNQFVHGDGGTNVIKPGDVILMHYRKGLAADFRWILQQIRQAGFRPAAVENYLPRSLGGNAPDPAPKPAG
ncbi:polysaccharide deacetylase family protein [Actinomadura craniellae]|uniref:Polysaccharide deacetylase family protein n=1 Tax=Actinomadura craniellae TaxID=2231787 RepID=A0A365H1Z2_9ACTN|nr:polysaccharide deacetylase family protein [Actinomadura craniellae]RAY13012.1 polysaccharide deacetylase family protein [Actinomadura craniellae]